MSYVLALLAGLAGAVVGWAAAAMIGYGIAGAIGMSNLDGAVGLFALFGVGPLGGALGLTLGIYVALRHRGYKTFRAIAARGLVVLIAVGGLAAGGAQVAGLIDMLGRDRPMLVMEFEIRGPRGFEFAGNAIAVELRTGSDRVPARLHTGGSDGGRPVLAGSVDVRFRASARVLVLSLPEQPRRLFNLDLPASPYPGPPAGNPFGPWRQVDLLDDMKPDRPPRSAPDTDGFDIRLRAAVRTAADR